MSKINRSANQSPYGTRPQPGNTSPTPSGGSSAFGGAHASPSSTTTSRRKKVDMDDFYQRKVEQCDRRIKRLEERIREFEAGEERMRERTASRQQMGAARGGAGGLNTSASNADMSTTSAAGGGHSPKRVVLDKEAEQKMVERLTYIRERETASALPPIDASRPARQMWLKLKPNKEFEDDTEDGSIDVEGMVQRLGVDDVENRAGNVETRLEEAEANGVKEMWRQSVKQISIARRRRNEEEEEIDEDEEDEELYVLSEERMAALGTRLCNDSLDHRKQVLAALEEKYYGADVNKSAVIEQSRQRRLQKEGGGGDAEARPVSSKEIGARLHDASMAKKADTMAKLEGMYIEPLNLIRTKTGELKPLPKLTKERFDDMVNRLSTKK